MTGEPRFVARSNHYRSTTLLERVGDAVGRVVGRGAVRAALRDVYHTLLFGFTGGRGLESTLPGGEVVRLHPRFRFATWNAVEYAALREASHAGDVAIDVGANVGAYTLLFGLWVGSRGHVYAFEPAAGARDGLTRHIALNGLERVVTVRPEAMMGEDGVVPFSGNDTSGANRVLGGAERAGALTVPTVTLDHFCTGHALRPAVVKIDVEGAELDVLRGARETIASGRGRIAVFVELHPDVWPAVGVSRADVEAELDFQGLRVVPLQPDHDPWTVNGECVRLVPR